MEVAKTVGELRTSKAYSDNQAAGHAGIMLFEGERLLKKGKQSEINFLEWLSTQTNPDLMELKALAPRYFGIEERNGNKYIVLENLLFGYDYPNIIDCKLGRIT